MTSVKGVLEKRLTGGRWHPRWCYIVGKVLYVGKVPHNASSSHRLAKVRRWSMKLGRDIGTAVGRTSKRQTPSSKREEDVSNECTNINWFDLPAAHKLKVALKTLAESKPGEAMFTLKLQQDEKSPKLMLRMIGPEDNCKKWLKILLTFKKKSAQEMSATAEGQPKIVLLKSDQRSIQSSAASLQEDAARFSVSYDEFGIEKLPFGEESASDEAMREQPPQVVSRAPPAPETGPVETKADMSTTTDVSQYWSDHSFAVQRREVSTDGSCDATQEETRSSSLHLPLDSSMSSRTFSSGDNPPQLSDDTYDYAATQSDNQGPYWSCAQADNAGYGSQDYRILDYAPVYTFRQAKHHKAHNKI